MISAGDAVVSPRFQQITSRRGARVRKRWPSLTVPAIRAARFGTRIDEYGAIDVAGCVGLDPADCTVNSPGFAELAGIAEIRFYALFDFEAFRDSLARRQTAYIWRHDLLHSPATRRDLFRPENRYSNGHTVSIFYSRTEMTRP